MKKRRMNPLKFIKRNGRIVVGGAIIAALIIIAIFAPHIATHDPQATDYSAMMQLPSEEHILGTDANGRDLFSRLIYGTRMSLIIAVGVNFFAVVGGAVIGILCGYFKRADAILMRIMEVVHALPQILLSLVIASVLGRGTWKMMISLIVVALPGVCRMTRSQVLSIKQKEFIEVEKTMGASTGRILFMHVLPSASHYLIIRFTTGLAGTILSASSLSYLGVGFDPTIPNWGAMIADGQKMMMIHPHLMLYPGIAIAIAVFAFNLFGEGLREKLDPRLK